MTDNIFLNTSLKKKRFSLWMVLLCIFVTDAMSFPVSQNVKVLFISFIGLMALLQIILDKTYKPTAFENQIVVIYILLILFVQFIHFDFSLSYEYKIFQLLIGLLIARSLSIPTFGYRYVQVMKVVVILSILIWLLLATGIPFWQYFPESGEGDYHTMFFYVVMKDLPDKIRNFGPFYEPGIYQIYLNVALAFYLFSVKKYFSKFTLYILIVGIISTFSTAGYFCMSLLLIAYKYEESNKLSIKNAFILLFFLTAILLLLSNPAIDELVFGKLSIENSSYKSFAIRLNDIIYYFDVWKSNPIFGAGFSSAYDTVMDMHFFGNFKYGGNTSTTMRELASYGIIVGGISIIAIFIFAKRLAKKRLSKFIVFAVLLIMINCEGMVLSLFLNTIICFGLSTNNHKLSSNSA